MSSTLGLTNADTGVSASVGDTRVLGDVKTRLRQAREHRRQYEPTWALNLAYAAGDHWAAWDPAQRTLRRIQDLDQRYRDRELYSVDVITEYRTTALGELGGDDDRPQILTARDGEDAEAFEKQLNRAIAYAWDHEMDADTVLAEADRICVDLGTSAARCVWDGGAGKPMMQDVPHMDGKPILDLETARQTVAEAAGNGVTLDFKDVNEGRIRWEAISPLGMLVPPGITHEDRFPWEAVVRPVYLPDVQDMYGDVAADLRADGDILSDLGLMTQGAVANGISWDQKASREGRLRDHVWVFTYYERPTRKFPKGREITLASNAMTPLAYDETLPYQNSKEDWCSGIAYFHWWRATGRFWSRGLMDVLRDPQRIMDKRKTQINEIIDRGMPFVFIQNNSAAAQRIGYPMEMIPLRPDERTPQVVNGIQPGPWLQADVEATREDMEHASGIRGPRLGENPTGVSTYSQLALLSQNEQTKRNPTRQDRQRAIRRLIEYTVYDMRTYWGAQKQLMVAGDDNKVDAELFNATQIPTWYLVTQAKGTPRPLNQAAQLQLITDIWNASVTSAQPLPVKWYKESLEAGKPLDLPQEDQEDPTDKAELENYMMVTGINGQPTDMPIAYYDPHMVHLPIHRRAQDDALFSNDIATWQRIDAHCRRHEAAEQAQQAAAQQAAMTGMAAGAIAAKPPAIQGPQNGRNPGPSGPPVPNQSGGPG